MADVPCAPKQYFQTNYKKLVKHYLDSQIAPVIYLVAHQHLNVHFKFKHDSKLFKITSNFLWQCQTLQRI